MPSCTASSLPSRAVHGCCVSGRQNAARMPAALPLLVRRALAGTAGSTHARQWWCRAPAAPAAPAAVPCRRQNNGPEMCAAPAAGRCARRDNRPEPLLPGQRSCTEKPVSQKACTERTAPSSSSTAAKQRVPARPKQNSTPRSTASTAPQHSSSRPGDSGR